MPVRGIDHVNIRTPLFEESIAFFEQALGLRRGPAASAGGRADNMWLYNEEGRALIHVNGPRQGEAIAERGSVSRLHHVALACTGLAATRARLAAMGVEVHEVRLASRGLLQLNIADPNGILIELLFEEEAEGGPDR